MNKKDAVDYEETIRLLEKENRMLQKDNDRMKDQLCRWADMFDYFKDGFEDIFGVSIEQYEIRL